MPSRHLQRPRSRVPRKGYPARGFDRTHSPRNARNVPFEVPYEEDEDAVHEGKYGDGHWGAGYQDEQDAFDAAYDSGADGYVIVVHGADGLFWLYFMENPNYEE